MYIWAPGVIHHFRVQNPDPAFSDVRPSEIIIIIMIFRFLTKARQPGVNSYAWASGSTADLWLENVDAMFGLAWSPSK